MPPRRRAAPRSASRRNQASPTPLRSDVDQDLLDTQNGTPQAQTMDDEPEQTPIVDAENDAASPAVDSQGATSPLNSQPSPATSPPPSGRGRGRGRGRRGRPATRKSELGTPEIGEDGSDTPVKKRRGGFRGGFRGRPRRGGLSAAYIQKQPVDKDGNLLEVDNDEIVVEEDPDGQLKVNRDGELQEGREYRVRTFSVAGRGNRLFMLSTEPARCTGYRDSYLFFNRHPQLFKIILDESEKKNLIEREVLPNSYKGRAIGVVTARSVFREFGARIVVGGRRVIDDFREQEARDRGDVEGELADPNDKVPAAGEAYNRNQYVAWHGASQVYHQNAPAGPITGGAPVAGRKRPRITGANWMIEHARAASIFNAELAVQRKINGKGLYDPHTNLVCYPQNTQPTQTTWEHVADDEAASSAKRRRLDLPNGDDVTFQYANIERPMSSFEKPSGMVSRNYLVVDTHFITPPHAALPRPGQRLGSVEDVLGTGSDHRCLPDLTNEELGTFAPETRQAYLKAKAVQDSWMGLWDGQQGRDTMRSSLKIGVGTL